MSISKIKHPFLYFGHGSSYSNKSIFCSVIFKDKLSSKDQLFIKKKLPEPLVERLITYGNCVSIYSSDAYDGEALKYAGNTADGEEYELWLEFENILESKLLEIHKKLKIISVYKTSNPYYGNRFSQWHFYSIENLFTVFLPAFKKSISGTKSKVKFIDAAYKDLYYSLFGYINAYMERKFPLKIGNLNDLFSIIGKTNNFISGNEEKSFFYSTVTVLKRLLKGLSENEFNKYFKNLPIAFRVKIITKDNCDYLFREDKSFDKNRLELLIKEAKPENEKLLSDLYSELIGCDKLNLRKNLEDKRFVHRKITEHINKNNLSESLAVNVLFNLINFSKKDRGEFIKLEEKLKEIIEEREDLLTSELIKKNIALI